MRTKKALLVGVALAFVAIALGCGSKKSADNGCTGAGVITFTATPAAGGSTMESFSCGLLITVGSDTDASYTTNDGSSSNNGDAVVTIPGLSPAPGTFAITSGGDADFYYSHINADVDDNSAQNCFDAGLTSNGTITVTSITASTVSGSFSIPKLCFFGGTTAFTDVTGTFSYP